MKINIKAIFFVFVMVFPIIVFSGEKNTSAWKTEDEFRSAEKQVVSKANWLLENPSSDSWSDSLQYILEWGNGVPYLMFEIYGPYSLKIAEEAKNSRIMGRISTMLLVGCIKYGIENKQSISKKEMTKASLMFVVDYYGRILKGHEDSRIKIMEAIKDEINKDNLKSYLNKNISE